MKSIIRFEDYKLRQAFYKLRVKNPSLFKQVNHALDKIEQNAFSGIQIPKRLFPPKWRIYTNLWKYNLPGGWRIIYTMAPPDRKGEIIVLAIILEWIPHKEYEGLFKY